MAGASSAGLKITAAQANVKDEAYGTDFFKGFDLVMNALDNLDARYISFADGCSASEFGADGMWW